MTNYRLEGLTRRTEEIVQELKEDGLMGADIEVIGALLFTKFQGQDDKMSEMLFTRKIKKQNRISYDIINNFNFNSCRSTVFYHNNVFCNSNRKVC